MPCVVSLSSAFEIPFEVHVHAYVWLMYAAYVPFCYFVVPLKYAWLGLRMDSIVGRATVKRAVLRVHVHVQLYVYV